MSPPSTLGVAGISLDCHDPDELARFYVELLGGRTLWVDAVSAGIRLETGLTLIAQKISGYSRPVWPGFSVIHLDLDAAGNLQHAVDRALACGAELAAHQPDPRWRVLLDPAGHPFCITTEVWSQ